MNNQNISNDRRILYPQKITTNKCSNYDLDKEEYMTEEQRIFLYDLHLEQIETM